MQKRHGIMSLTLMLAAVGTMLVLTAGTAAAGDWKGSVQTIDGRKTVVNPATPMMEPTSVKMEELWRLGGETDDEDEFFGVISDIEIDSDGNVYLLDSQLSDVKIYTKDGEFIRSIGREGEGPGEFRRPSALFFTDDGNVAVVQTVPGKIVVLSREGDPVGDFPLPATDDGGFQLLMGGAARGGNTVLYMGRTQFNQGEGKWSRSDFLTSVDDKGNQLATYATKSNTINMAAAELDDARWDTIERRWEVGPQGKVYACESYPDYAINVYGKDGTLDEVITREYKHRARTSDEKEFMTKMMTHFAQRMPGCKVTINDNCKDIERVYVRDDGAIWVMNSTGARDVPDGSVGVFDVYNKDGQFVRTVTLEGEGDPLDDLYVFVKDRFYVVTDFLQAAMVAEGASGLYDDAEEAAPMAVICYRLDGNVLAAR